MSRKSQDRSVKKRRVARPRRGTLVLIAALLMSSAIIRVGHDAGRAFAKQSAPTMTSQPARTELASCTPSSDTSKMLIAFQKREARLEEREFQLRARMQALSVVDQEVTEKMAALTQAENELRKTLALADAAAENDLTKLTSVYENMKPKDAAALFEETDPNFSAGFLGRMRAETAAAIMAGLTPQTAYTISAILAGRNADVPKE